MIPGDSVPPRLETRLNLLSRQILILVGERGSLDLETLAAALSVPPDLGALAVGWLARSRVIDLTEDASGRICVQVRRPLE
ncbi:MAG TPA: hypothetical protein VE981_23065 [Planctomycetota bacterium]|nr:hypothetical protein [Planctomycetota bacterium]